MVSASEVEAEVDTVDVEPGFDPKLEIQPRGLIKRLLPRTMFGRSLLIVVMPLVMLQAIATWIFYDRHWAAVSWRLSTGVAGDIALRARRSLDSRRSLHAGYSRAGSGGLCPMAAVITARRCRLKISDAC